MTDIEDAITQGSVLEPRKDFQSAVVLKSKNDTHAVGNDPHLPGKQNVFLKVWGCSHNVSDKGEFFSFLYPGKVSPTHPCAVWSYCRRA